MALRYRNQKQKRTATYILIDDGFDELEVIYFLHKFRRAGLPIKSVSLFNTLVFSRQGVGLKADYQLADHPIDPSQDCLLVLPTGGRNGDMLRRDARIKSLLCDFTKGNGRIAITNVTPHLLKTYFNSCKTARHISHKSTKT
ncbi:MAG: DJ-1/PfpI family protein [Chloroflexota bacterium]